MKTTALKGHPLTEKEMCEVKGGMWYAIKMVTDPNKEPDPFLCEGCGYEITEFEYNEQGGNYVAVCFNCGCKKEVKIEE